VRTPFAADARWPERGDQQVGVDGSELIGTEWDPVCKQPIYKVAVKVEKVLR
jgi:hypothetical protein